MFGLFAQLQRTDKERQAHVRLLATVVRSAEHQDVFEHLYACLSILDAKSQSMLGSNAITLAVFAVFMTRELSLNEWLVAGCGVAMLLASSFLLLSVVWIHWSTSQDFEDAEAHARRLLQVRNERTVRYRLAWVLASVSLVSLGFQWTIRLLAKTTTP